MIGFGTTFPRLGLPLSLCLFVATAHAVPADVARIFDKNKRQLQTPPNSLRSSTANEESRYFSGMDRVQRRVSSQPAATQQDSAVSETSEMEISTLPSNNAVVQPVQAPPSARSVPAQSSRVVIVRDGREGAREERRQQSLGTYGFSGRRVFGVGFVGAGSYGIFGAEVDFGFGNDWSGGIGIGTGMAYSTWGFHARKYFQTGNLTPYFQVGYANWMLQRDPYRESELYPVYLGEQFLQKKDGQFKVQERVHLIYPALGVLFQSSSGLAFSMQLQYLISALDFKGALAGGFGLHFYF